MQAGADDSTKTVRGKIFVLETSELLHPKTSTTQRETAPMVPGTNINFGDLTKPATVLIEKISEAIGGIFRPHQIRRIAEAEAEASRIKTVSEIEITDLQRRAIQRFFSEEAKKQQNIESITAMALPQLAEHASPENIEDDWITNFFDKCRLISDLDMQTLWSRLLSGEANSPGRFSKRTINVSLLIG